MQAALTKVTDTFELEPRIEAMREAQPHRRITLLSDQDVPQRPLTVAHDPGLEFTFFADAKPHFGLNDIRWAT